MAVIECTHGCRVRIAPWGRTTAVLQVTDAEGTAQAVVPIEELEQAVANTKAEIEQRRA